MQKTPKSNRLQIGIFGRTNVGKSSLLNYIADQNIAITSAVPGTTTDVVEKAMELLPLGPVLFVDTAGLDDQSELAALRIEKTRQVFDRIDIALVVVEANSLSDVECDLFKGLSARGTPVIAIINKSDLQKASDDFKSQIRAFTSFLLELSATNPQERESTRNRLKQLLIDACPEDFVNSQSLIGDLLSAGELVVMMVPIDLQAPKGRLILPQVQAIRDALDNDAAAMVVKDREFTAILDQLRAPPALVICDSQVVLKMVAETPSNVRCTTFSILFSRNRGDLNEAARGVSAVKTLRAGDKVLIAEACSHHAAQDDIGRVKIPRWVRQYVGQDLHFDVNSGIDYPENLSEYKLVIHCGGCMLNRRAMLSRIQRAREAAVPITNYGVCISYVQGVLERVLSPFPAALDAFRQRASQAH